jgi:hypothetical protein
VVETASDAGLGAQVAHALQLFLGLIFVVSAATKLRDPRAFRRTVLGYALLPTPLAGVASAVVIGAETALAVALLTGWMATVAVPVAGALVGLFLVAVAVNLRRGNRVACGCFGGDDAISGATVARLASLLALVAVLLAMPESVPLDQVVADGRGAFSYVVEIGALAAAMVAIAAWLTHPREAVFAIGNLRQVRAVSRGGSSGPAGGS